MHLLFLPICCQLPWFLSWYSISCAALQIQLKFSISIHKHEVNTVSFYYCCSLLQVFVQQKLWENCHAAVWLRHCGEMSILALQYYYVAHCVATVFLKYKWCQHLITCVHVLGFLLCVHLDLLCYVTDLQRKLSSWKCQHHFLNIWV